MLIANKKTALTLGGRVTEKILEKSFEIKKNRLTQKKRLTLLQTKIGFPRWQNVFIWDAQIHVERNGWQVGRIQI